LNQGRRGKKKGGEKNRNVVRPKTGKTPSNQIPDSWGNLLNGRNRKKNPTIRNRLEECINYRQIKIIKTFKTTRGVPTKGGDARENTKESWSRVRKNLVKSKCHLQRGPG